jgi:hypothetical protein
MFYFTPPPKRKRNHLIHTHLIVVRYKHEIIDHKTVILLEHECQCRNLRQLLRTVSKIKESHQNDQKILAISTSRTKSGGRRETDRNPSTKFTWVHNNTPKEILER